jgi:hypothetical protein
MCGRQPYVHSEQVLTASPAYRLRGSHRCLVVTANFRILYELVIMELGTRRILHHNVSTHPTAEWTLQQFREALPGDHPHQFLIHDRDSIFSKDLDKQVVAMGSLGPAQDSVPDSGHRHRLPAGYRVVKDSVLGGLHHEYRLVKEVA